LCAEVDDVRSVEEVRDIENVAGASRSYERSGTRQRSIEDTVPAIGRFVSGRDDIPLKRRASYFYLRRVLAVDPAAVRPGIGLDEIGPVPVGLKRWVSDGSEFERGLPGIPLSDGISYGTNIGDFVPRD